MREGSPRILLFDGMEISEGRQDAFCSLRTHARYTVCLCDAVLTERWEWDASYTVISRTHARYTVLGVDRRTCSIL